MSLMKRNTNNWLADFFNPDELFDFNLAKFDWMPKVNIKEEKDKYDIELAAPGLKKDDFKIEVNGNVMSISSEKKEEKKEEKENFSRREFSYSSFNRSFTLPESVEKDKIDANYEDGVLKISLPKNEESKKKEPKTIKIK